MSRLDDDLKHELMQWAAFYVSVPYIDEIVMEILCCGGVSDTSSRFFSSGAPHAARFQGHLPFRGVPGQIHDALQEILAGVVHVIDPHTLGKEK